MKKITISVEELLASQVHQGLRATLEEVKDHKNQVKLTPFFPGHGCHCGSSIVIPKDTLASLTLTGETHFCCGKTLKVVEIQFKKGATMALDAVFEQLSINAAHASVPHGHSPEFSGIQPESLVANPILARCRARYETCLSTAQDDFDRCMCKNMYCFCTGACRATQCPKPSF